MTDPETERVDALADALVDAIRDVGTRNRPDLPKDGWPAYWTAKDEASVLLVNDLAAAILAALTAEGWGVERVGQGYQALYVASVKREERAFDERVFTERLTGAACRLSDAISIRVAVQGQGWEAEMDADQEHLAAVKALRALLPAPVALGGPDATD